MPNQKEYPDSRIDRLIASLVPVWKDPQDYLLIAMTIQTLDTRYELGKKMAREPGVAEIIQQMAGRLANAYGSLSEIKGKRILDIACGSNTSRMPGSISVNTPFGRLSVGGGRGYTALFEPWFCRILFHLGARPFGVDFGDLDREVFEHQRVDLGEPDALAFLRKGSFDAIQDSRLFGSPEFTAQFPQPADRLKVAEEIVKQEKRLLKKKGIIIHSDAMDWVE